MDSDVTSTDNFIKLKRALQEFQSGRINRTYKDIEADPEFAKIGNFFFNKAVCTPGFLVSGHEHEKASQGPGWKGL